MKSRLKGKKKNRIIAVVSALAVVVGMIGAIAANEVKEEVYYEAPELYLVQGAESYDLTAGISFDADRYTLDIADMGGFDINVPGSYEITYSLTPVPKAPENTIPAEPSEGGVPTVSEGEAASPSEGEATSPSEGEITTPDEGTTPSEDGSGEAGNTAPEAEAVEIFEEEVAKAAATEQTVSQNEAVTGDVFYFTRLVIVEKAKVLTFEAPALYITTTNTECDLTADVTALDELENPVAEIYVVEEEELLAAKETIMDEESGATREEFAPGTYYITLGAKHPVTEEEFTTIREVNVGTGYYIYAPDMEIETATTQYDLLEGVELRKYDDGSVAENATITVEPSDLHALEQIAMTEEEVMEFIEDMEKAGEEPAAAMETMLLAEEGEETASNPPLKEGTYSYEIHAVDEETGEVYSTVRMLNVRTIKNNYSMWFEAGAYKDRLEEMYQEGDVDGLVLGVDMSNAFYRMKDGAQEPSVPNGYSNYITRSLGERGSGILQSSRFERHPVRTTYHYDQIGTPTIAEVLGLTVDFEIMKSKELDINYNFVGWSYMGALVRSGRTTTYGTKTNGQYDELRHSYVNNKFFKGELYYTFQTRTMQSSYTGYIADAYFWDWAAETERRDVSKVRGDWNNYLNGVRDKEQFRYGGEPDVTVTANTGKKITAANLDFENFMTHIENVTPEASIRIDINGEDLNGSNIAQQLPAMQISLENGKLDTKGETKRLVYTAPENTWLRFKGFQTTDALLENTTDNLLSKQLKLTLAGGNTVEFIGGDTLGDELFALVENTSGKTSRISLITERGHGDINAPKYFQVSGAGSDYDYIVNAAEGTKIEAFNLSAKKTTENANSPAHSLTLGGGGVLRFNNTTNIPGATATYSQAYTKRVDLNSDITVLKSGKSPAGGDALTLPAVRIADGFLHNGYKIAAGVNKDGDAEPEAGELFAKADTFVLDPTDFTVNTNPEDGAWVNNDTWFMANADGNPSEIVFMQDAVIGKTPIEVTHGGTTKHFSSYKLALEYIDADTGGDTEYTVKNLRSMDFTGEDLTALAGMTGTGKSITFTGGTTGAGAVTYGDCYHIRFREPVVTMPEGYDIIWNQPVKYDQGNRENTTEKKVPDLIFIGNGNKTTFDNSFSTVNPVRENENTPDTFGEAERQNYAYGGAATGNFATASEITVKAGRFEAVYGGNRKGSHTGDATIILDSTVSGEAAIYINRLDGASEGEQAKPTGRRATISTTGAVKVQNIYNYDELTVESETLTIPEGANEKDTNINAMEARGYLGKTVLKDEAALNLLNNNGVRKLGSIVRPDTADTAKTAGLILARAVTVGTDTAASTANPYILELTDKDPLGMDNFQADRRVTVSYDAASVEEADDIVFYLSGVENTTAAKKKYITVKPLSKGFIMEMISDNAAQTIKLAEVSVLLIFEDGSKETKMDVAGAVLGIADAEELTPGGKYTIAIFKENYKLGALDESAVEYVLGRKTGDFTYLENDYSNLPKAATAAQITWCSNYDDHGNKKTDYATVQPQVNFDFFGQKTVLQEIKLDYSGNTTKKNLYANGKPLTVEESVSLVGAVYPNLYGAGEYAAAATKLTLKGGTFDAVYGGTTKKAVTVAGAKEVEILKTVVVNDLKDFTALTVGDAGTDKVLLTINGKLDSNPDTLLNDRADTVSLKHGEILFAGNEQGHIGNLVTDTNENTINIHKDAVLKTRPMLLDGKVTLADADHPVTININGQNAARRDIVLTFSEEINAIREQYQADANMPGLTEGTFLKYNQNIVLDRKGIMFLKSDNIEGNMDWILSRDGNHYTAYNYAKVDPDSLEIDEAAASDWNNFSARTHAGLKDGNDDPEVYVTFDANTAIDIHNWNSLSPFAQNFSNLTFGKTTVDGNVGTDYGIRNITPDSSITIDFNNGNTGKDRVIRAERTNAGSDAMMSFPSMQIKLKDVYYVNNGAGAGMAGGICGATIMTVPDNGYLIADSWRQAPDDTAAPSDPKTNTWCVIQGLMDDNGRPYTNTRYSKNAMVEIIMSDVSEDNPNYMLSYLDEVTVRLSAATQHRKNIRISDINNKVTVYTNGSALKLHEMVRAAGKDPVLVIEGGGALWTGYDVDYGYGRERGIIDMGSITLNSDVTVAKSLNHGEGDSTIYLSGADPMQANGSRIIGARANGVKNGAITGEEALREGDVFAKASNADTDVTLDATDFVLKEFPGETEGLYFTSRDGGRTIYVTKKEHLVEVSPAVNGETFFNSYKEAFEAIKADGEGREYTVRNLNELDFTQEDKAALEAVISDKATKLILESGIREDGTTDGKAGTRYRIRMRVQTLQLPKDIDVTFQNAVIKYDEGTNSEITEQVNGQTVHVQDMVFAGNGGELLFGEGVVLLQHNDEYMYPTIYGGSNTTALTDSSAVIIKSGTFGAVYGGGTAPQTGNTSVYVMGGTLKSVYGGGSTGGDVNGNATVDIKGGAIKNPVYGGGEGSGVTGNTTMSLSDSYPFAADAADKSIYGGGKGGVVGGKSNITITINNTAAEADFIGKVLSGSGTDADGNLADNVQGEKTITVLTTNRDNRATLVGEKLTGFDVLNVGNADAVNCDNLILKATKRFDSRPVDMAPEDNGRSDRVNLNASSLVMEGEWNGHIGSLNMNGICSIQITKKAPGQTYPLLMDGKPSHTGGRRTLLKNNTGVNDIGDIVLRFTFPEGGNLSADEKEHYKDAYTPPLNISQEQKGTGTAADPNYVDIFFDIPPAHIVEEWIEYPEDTVNGTKLDETAANQKVKKKLHLTYDKDNKHEVRNGYIIAMPKTGVTEADMAVYTGTNSGFIENGVLGADMDGYETYLVTFTQGTETGKEGVHAAEGITEEIEIDADNYWYIAHVVCDHKENYDFLVDVSEPVESTGVNVLSDVALDSTTGNYVYQIRMQDASEKDSNKLPYIKYGAVNWYMGYNGEGIQAAYWAVSDSLNKANPDADTEAARRTPQPSEVNGLNAAASVTNVDGSVPVKDANVAVITLEVPKKTVEANKDGSIWIYAKDGVNNTVKLEIPLNPNQIDVTVPLKVGVVVVKDSLNGVEEILAPDCYIQNNGTLKLETQINSFTADNAWNTLKSPNLSLTADKQQSADYTESELALRLKKNNVWWNSFTETNVLSVDSTNPLDLGTLEPKGTVDGTDKKDILSYTFGAAYNAWTINYPDGEDGGTMKYIMGYHFRVVQ